MLLTCAGGRGGGMMPGIGCEGSTLVGWGGALVGGMGGLGRSSESNLSVALVIPLLMFWFD